MKRMRDGDPFYTRIPRTTRSRYLNHIFAFREPDCGTPFMFPSVVWAVTTPVAATVYIARFLPCILAFPGRFIYPGNLHPWKFAAESATVPVNIINNVGPTFESYTVVNSFIIIQMNVQRIAGDI